MSAKRLVIAGGGTGGHLFPGVAVAEEFMEEHPDGEVLFVGTKAGIESRILPKTKWQLKHIEVSGIKTVGLRGAIIGGLRIPGALWQSRRILKEFKADVVIGVGGYASGPVVLAAALMGKATAILEQNSIPGLTNRILGKFAKRIFLSFEHSASFFKAKKSALVGNPIRKQILQSLQQAQRSGSPDRPLRLFVFGGSQGAVSVNQMCVQAAAALQARGIVLDIVHQTGTGNLEATLALYAKAGVTADCRAFIQDMASEYIAADIIVSRAGATTIAELGIVGLPAILIPYPFAANNHQELNAEEMVAAGAALMLKQGEDAHQSLTSMLADLAENPSKRETMAAAMREFGRPNAASEIVRWME